MSAVLHITSPRGPPCAYPAQQSSSPHPAMAFAAPWPCPVAHAYVNRARLPAIAGCIPVASRRRQRFQPGNFPGTGLVAAAYGNPTAGQIMISYLGYDSFSGGDPKLVRRHLIPVACSPHEPTGRANARPMTGSATCGTDPGCRRRPRIRATDGSSELRVLDQSNEDRSIFPQMWKRSGAGSSS
jgi:hypothetical protein